MVGPGSDDLAAVGRMKVHDFREFRAWKPVYPPCVIGDGILYKEGKAFLYGRPKSFKSLLAMYLLTAASEGVPWLGHDTPEEGTKVLYVQAEMPHSLLHKTFFKMWGGWTRGTNNAEPIILPTFATDFQLRLDTTGGLKSLDKLMEEKKPGLVILDSAYKVMAGDLRDSDAVRHFLNNLDQLIEKHKIALILMAHSRKATMEENEWGSDDMHGSVFFSAWADSVIKVTREVTKDGKPTQDLTVDFSVVRYAEELLGEEEVTLDEKTLQFRPRGGSIST